MLTHPTLDQLKALNLDGMADAFVELQNQAQATELSHAEWLALLLDREAANRNTRRFQIRLRSAKLRHSQSQPPAPSSSRQGNVAACVARWRRSPPG
jgi:DNA replication protein DnaC